MDARCLIPVLSGLLLAGCSSGGNTELMERELRLQEDRIYYLEDELARCCEAMQCRDAELASLRNGRPVKSPAGRTARPAPASSSPAELPKVELELPEAPAPLNSLPSLFDPASPEGEVAKGTAVRIVKPAQGAERESAAVAATNSQSSAPRMRFGTSIDGKARAEPSRVVMQWSTPASDRAIVEPDQPAPRTAVAPRRPQWTPYR